MSSKKKRMKRTTGIRRRSFLGIAVILFAENSHAVIAGTVFRETGHAFAGVEVSLTPDSPSKKNKKQTFRCNTRGEFAFRVPAAPQEYTLAVSPDGYRAEQKRVKILGDERIEHNFLLDRATKEK